MIWLIISEDDGTPSLYLINAKTKAEALAKADHKAVSPRNTIKLIKEYACA